MRKSFFKQVCNYISPTFYNEYKDYILIDFSTAFGNMLRLKIAAAAPFSSTLPVTGEYFEIFAGFLGNFIGVCRTFFIITSLCSKSLKGV